MKSDRSVMQSLTMITQFGINMLVPILTCSLLGAFLDAKLGTSFLVILLFFFGAVSGFWNIYRLSRAIFQKESPESAYLHKGRAAGRRKKDGKEKDHEGKNPEDKQNTV